MSEELAGLDRKEVDKVMKQLKEEGAIVSPVRCKWLSLGESVSYVAERSEKHAGAVVAGELTKPSGCALH